MKQRDRGKAPQAMLPCLGAPSRPEDSDTPARGDRAAGAPGPEASFWAGPEKSARDSRRGLFRSRSAVLGPRSDGAMGSRGPLPPKLRAHARLASVRPAQRPPLLATLTGPSHGAPRAPPARPGAAATAAAAIPGPGAAPHPAPPQLGRPEMASSAFRPRRGQMASPPRPKSDAQEYPGREGGSP